MGSIDWASLHKDATTVLEGEFPAVISKATAGTTTTGKPCIKLQVKIESGAYIGRTILHMFTISGDNPVAQNILFRDLATLGLGTAFFAQGPTTEGVAEALVGKRATIVLENRPYNGQDRESIKSFRPAEGVAPEGASVVVNTGGAIGSDLSSLNASTISQGETPQVASPETMPPDDPF